MQTVFCENRIACLPTTDVIGNVCQQQIKVLVKGLINDAFMKFTYAGQQTIGRYDPTLIR